MDYEDLDSVLRAREQNRCNGSTENSRFGDRSLSFVQQHGGFKTNSVGPTGLHELTDQRVGSPSARTDAVSVVYAQVNRGDKNLSRTVLPENDYDFYSKSASCCSESNENDLYSVVRKDSSSSGTRFGTYGRGNSLAVAHAGGDDRFCDFYQLEKPVTLPAGFDYDLAYDPYEEVDRKDFACRGRRFDDQGENDPYSFIRSDSWIQDRQEQGSMSLAGAMCTRCQQGFNKEEEIVNSNGQIWHRKCFVCGQCFQQFPDGVFYEFEGRKYCEHDFNVLFAPCCGLCKEFIIGRVIKAMNLSWHPDCFSCQLCQAPLADAGFIKNAGRALCRECNAKEKALGMGKYVCHKCHSIIEEGHIKYKGEVYHPYHFNCTTCSVELNADAREKGGELYCLRCHDKMGIPICGACRRPIEERVVYALGKAWHVEHFVCAKCEKPFLGTRHYEKKGLAYCETHYHQLFGNICFVCNCVVAGDVFTALNKAWCVDHFACSVCDRKMSQKTKFFEVDLKPVCKTCYEKFPAELKKRLKKAYDQQMKK